MKSELHYDPPFIPGDVLEIKGYKQKGLVTGSKLGTAISEILNGKPVRVYQILFYLPTNEEFAHGEFMEEDLIEAAKKVGSLKFDEMTYGFADVAEVLSENQSLNNKLNAAYDHIESLRRLKDEKG